ncbi:MAG TPA: hypothetical protein VFI31_21180, partial [Pirellulales bacterium]|nr:hypothetical protein [Pirellulales bacterium]
YRERKLAAAVSLSPDRDPPRQVVLRACGTISGRVVDAQHKPVADLYLHVNAAPPASERATGWAGASLNSRHQIDVVRTDQDGRFRLERVPPGIACVISAQFAPATFEKKTPVIEPGQSLDVGELVLQPAKAGNNDAQPQVDSKATSTDDPKTHAQEPENQSGSVKADLGSEERITLRGRVLLPNGKPAAGAEIYWMQSKSTGPQSPGELWWEKRATTDAEGRFQWTLEKTDAKIGPSNRPPLVAYKSGFGLDGITIGRDEASAEINLRLVKEQTIRGRITDTEGRPVAAKIVVANIQATKEGPLDRLLERWKRTPQELRGTPEGIVYLYQRFGPLTAETDAEGRFSIAGVGAERVATLNVTAPGYMSDGLRIVTREGFDAAEYNKALTASTNPAMRNPGWPPRFAGPVFDHVMEAELVIRGFVFTGPDRKPVAGARVGAASGTLGQNLTNIPMTDAAGRFELGGVRRSQTVPLSVAPPGDLLTRLLRLDVAPGQTSLDVEVELKEGIVVEGRIFDQATGLGVHGNVSYVPLGENRFVDQPGYDGAKNMRGFFMTDADGRFRRLVPPGPGVLMAQVQPGRPQVDGNKPIRYRQASFNDEDSQRVPTTVRDDNRFFTISENQIIFLSGFGAAKVIDPAPGSGPLTCDLPLDPGKAVKLAIEDEQGQPVTDAWVAGVTDLWPITFKIAESSCTIFGLGADRSRRVCILHPERHLAAALTLTGDELGPVTVVLGAPASIVGRALDPDGEPLAEAEVQINYNRRSASELQRFVNQESAPLKTGADGRYRVENVLPGERLALGFKQGDAYFYIDGLTTEQRQLEAGQKLELGDVKVKQAR